MEIQEWLPKINACLNATSALLLLSGRYFIAKKQINAHRNAMVGAFLTSTIFLICYLIRFWLTGTHRFVGSWGLTLIYRCILFSHMILAIVVVPLILRALYFAFRNDIPKHKRTVRWAFPIWLYVSVTGVIVYAMLYHLSG